MAAAWRLAACALALVMLTPIAAAQGSDAPPWAPGGPTRGSDLRVMLVTVGPGKDLASRWGHSGLLVADEARGVSLFYNYGHVDGAGLDVVAGIMIGAREFTVEAFDSIAALKEFRDEGRTVLLRELRLPADDRFALARQLAHDALPENKRYAYDPYLDNCATRVRDIIDAATHGALANATRGRAGASSMREATESAIPTDGAYRWGVDLVSGPRADAPASAWDLLYLPDALDAAVTNLTLADGHPLVAQTTVYALGIASIATPLPPAGLAGPLAIGGAIGIVALGLGVAARQRERGAAWRRGADAWSIALSLAGGASGILLVAWALQGGAGAGNAYALAISPLWLAPAACLLAKRRRWHAAAWTVTLAVGAAGCALALARGQPAGPAAVIAPAALGLAAAAWLTASA